MDSAICIYKNADTTNMQYPEALIFMATLKEDAEDFKEAVVAGKTESLNSEPDEYLAYVINNHAYYYSLVTVVKRDKKIHF